MNKVTRKRTLQRASVTSAIALGVVVTGVGVASASTHATTPRQHTSVTAKPERHPAAAMTPGAPCGLGVDVTAISATSLTVSDPSGTSTTYAINAATSVTKHGQSATLNDVVVGDSVHVTVSPTDSTLASSIDIVPAGAVGKVTAINGDVLTITGPNGTSNAVIVNPSTTYMKAGASASFGDVSVGTVIFAQGSFGSSPTTIDATTVGIGQPGNGAPGPGPHGMGGPGGPPPGFAGPGPGAQSPFARTVS